MVWFMHCLRSSACLWQSIASRFRRMLKRSGLENQQLWDFDMMHLGVQLRYDAFVPGFATCLQNVKFSVTDMFHACASTV